MLPAWTDAACSRRSAPVGSRSRREVCSTRCTSGGSDEAGASGSPAPTAVSGPDPRAAAAEVERTLLAEATAVLDAYPELTATVQPVQDAHAAHIVALVGEVPSTTSAAPTAPPRARRRPRARRPRAPARRPRAARAWRSRERSAPACTPRAPPATRRRRRRALVASLSSLAAAQELGATRARAMTTRRRGVADWLPRRLHGRLRRRGRRPLRAGSTRPAATGCTSRRDRLRALVRRRRRDAVPPAAWYVAPPTPGPGVRPEPRSPASRIGSPAACAELGVVRTARSRPRGVGSDATAAVRAARWGAEVPVFPATQGALRLG